MLVYSRVQGMFFVGLLFHVFDRLSLVTSHFNKLPFLLHNSLSGSAMHQSATVSGNTSINTSAQGSGKADEEINATYECTVESNGKFAYISNNIYDNFSYGLYSFII